MKKAEREKAEDFARRFHEAYRELAPMYGWISDTTRTPWELLPAKNKNLMTATALHLLDCGAVEYRS